MSFEYFIAFRYLTSKCKHTFISVISLMSVVGVALGVAALVVVMGVYNGFSTDIRNKILGANSHILVQSSFPASFDLDENGQGGYKNIVKYISQLDGVRAVAPFLYTEVLVSTPRGATGLVIRGIDAKDTATTMPMLNNVVQGSVKDLVREKGVQGIIIGEELAKRFDLMVGERINLMSPTGTRTTAGFVPKIVPFRIAGIFKAGMSDYDNRLAFITLASAQELIGVNSGRVSGIEVFLENPYKADDIRNEINKNLGIPYYARDWMEMNAGLFAALQLERIGMFIVLALIILVGSFSIITSLVMLVMEKTKDIAVLMSMGAKPRSIQKIFILQGSFIGIAGTFLGLACGLVVALLLKEYQFIELPSGVYTLDHLPILLTWTDNIIICTVSMLMCFLATIYPARQASKLVPADALRYE